MFEEYRWYAVHTYSGYENKVADNIIKVADNRIYVASVYHPVKGLEGCPTWI